MSTSIAPGGAALPGAAMGQRLRAVELRRLAHDLEHVAAALRDVWASALPDGDFEEVARIVDTSHAVHAAVIVLREEGVKVGPWPVAEAPVPDDGR